jgi:hypothetical protein
MKVINSPLRSKETTKAGPNSQERTSLTLSEIRVEVGRRPNRRLGIARQGRQRKIAT